MSAALETIGLVRRFRDETAVDGIDLEVGPSEVHAIVGLNGAGKTTLMRLLLGMLRPDEGRALVTGVDATKADASVWSQVGHLVETLFFYPELTTKENIAAAALLHGVDPDEIEEASDAVIDRLALGPWANRRATKLSLGNRQRLGLATALVHDPHVLILDEPANALDPAGVVLTRDLLRQAASNGAAVLVSSHHLDQLARVAHFITVIHRGQIVGPLNPADSNLEQRFFDLVYQADQEMEPA